jgi:hypothetical protein
MRRTRFVNRTAPGFGGLRFQKLGAPTTSNGKPRAMLACQCPEVPVRYVLTPVHALVRSSTWDTLSAPRRKNACAFINISWQSNLPKRPFACAHSASAADATYSSAAAGRAPCTGTAAHAVALHAGTGLRPGATRHDLGRPVLPARTEELGTPANVSRIPHLLR